MAKERKIVVENGLEFHLGNRGLLLYVGPVGDIPKNAVIPHILESGDEIRALDAYFLEGNEWNEITISEGIEVKSRAFYDAIVNKVNWPSSCTEIPYKCFRDSDIKELTNIDGVEEVGEAAFMGADIASLKWPSACTVIPRDCFFASKLEEISGMENVEEVECGAFSCCEKLRNFNWPPKCEKIPSDCFIESGLESITGIEGVTSIGNEAFPHGFTGFDWPKNCYSDKEDVIARKREPSKPIIWHS